MTNEILVLRIVHVLGGIFWVGSGLFTTFFLMPALATVGPAAGQVMSGLQQRRLFTVLPIVATLTVLSGARLMWIMSGGFSAAYFAIPAGRTYALSGAATIVAFLLSLLVARPSAVRSGALMKELQHVTSDAERDRIMTALNRLRRRGAVVSMVAVALLILGAAGMAIARYLA